MSFVNSEHSQGMQILRKNLHFSFVLDLEQIVFYVTVC